MLPNESLLQVLHFADYKTLVLTKLAKVAFYASLRNLPKSWHVVATLQFPSISPNCGTKTLGAEGGIQYEWGNQASIASASRELAGLIGPHNVASLAFCGNAWNMPGIGVIFNGAPALKHADDVVLHSSGGSINECDSDDFMSNFAAMKPLRLWLDYNAFGRFFAGSSHANFEL